MAQDKNGILVYADWMKKFEALSDDEAGRLIKHFFRYVNDLNPVAPDRITELSFIDIEQCLKRDLVKWEKRAERSRENGRNGGRPSSSQNPEKPTETQRVILEPRKPDSDSVNGSVSVNVSDSVSEKEIKNNKGFSKKAVSEKPSSPSKKEVARQSFENTSCVFGNEFKKNWLELLSTKKWKSKEQSAIDLNLKKLMKFDEDFANALVENSIAGGYQGVVFSDTDLNYQKYLKSKNGQTGNSRDAAIESRHRMVDIATQILTGNQA